MARYIVPEKQKSVLNRITESQAKKEKKQRVIEIESHKVLNGRWSKLGWEYWNKLGVSVNQLERDTTFTVDVKRLWLDGKELKVEYPCFGYSFGDGIWKIYTPFAKEINAGSVTKKWMFNGTNENLWYLKKSKESLWITKSNKDVLVLDNHLDYSLMCFVNEGSHPSNLFELVKDYPTIYLNNDPDKAGLAFNKKLLKLIPWAVEKRFSWKDSADLVINESIDRLKLELL